MKYLKKFLQLFRLRRWPTDHRNPGLTLLEVSQRLDPDNDLAELVAALSEPNPLLEDVNWLPVVPDWITCA